MTGHRKGSCSVRERPGRQAANELRRPGRVNTGFADEYRIIVDERIVDLANAAAVYEAGT
jgi:hypothetical protein